MQTTDIQVAIAAIAPVDKEGDPDGVVVDMEGNPDGVVDVDSDCDPDEDVIAGVEVCDTMLVIEVPEAEIKEVEVGVTNVVETGY
jgi:hypothetical protein